MNLDKLKLNKRLIISIGLLLFLILTIFLAVYLVKQRQLIPKKAAEEEATLSLSPNSGTYDQNQTFPVNISLDTGGKPVVAVDVSLTFDSSKLQVQSVTPGSLFQNQVVLKNEVRGNKILLSLGSFTPATGSGVYGTINFLAQEIGETQIVFDESPYTKVAQQGGGNILDEIVNGSYTIVELVSPTPTPTPEPGKANLRFQIRFQGISGDKPVAIRVKGILKQDSEAKHEENITVENDGSGIFLDMFRDVEPGSYTVFIKGPVHLQKNFGEVILIADQIIEKDWTETELLTGDANGDNKVNIQDFGVLVEDYLTTDESLADFNFDGKVNIQDFRFIVENHLKEGD